MDQLITKAEHLAGEKLLQLEYRWGEKLRLTIKALGWRALQKLSRHAVEQKLDFDEHAEMLVKASLSPGSPENILDKLDAASASLLQRSCLALSLGEKAVTKADPEKNGEAAAAIPLPAIGPSSAGAPSATSSPPAGAKPISPNGPPRALPLPTRNSRESAPGPRCASS